MYHLLCLMKCLRNKRRKIISGQFELVVDGSDNFQTRYLVNDMCVKLSKPLVHGSIFKFEGQLALFNYREARTFATYILNRLMPKTFRTAMRLEYWALFRIIGTMMSEMALKVLLGDTQLSNKLLVLNLRDYTLKIFFYNYI